MAKYTGISTRRFGFWPRFLREFIMKEKLQTMRIWSVPYCYASAVMLLCLLPIWGMAANDYELHYVVGLDTAGHYLNVQLNYESKVAQQEVVLNMPVWSPGHYQIQDYPKHLCDFSARDSKGQPTTWQKEGKNRWRIFIPSDGKVVVNYRVYSNNPYLLNVEHCQVMSDIAFVSPTMVFMHVDGDLLHPVEVTYISPDNWSHISSGLRPQADSPYHFIVKDFDTLYDSPLMFGNFYNKKFIHEGHEYEFAVEVPDSLEESNFEEDFKRIVTATTQLMGDVPYDNYALLSLREGYAGLEHFNSQASPFDVAYSLQSRENYYNLLDYVAHEYFHVYNVKCIRPAELWPIDYNKEAFTPMLWVSEGLTCYYSHRLLLNSGLITPEEYLELFSNDLRSYVFSEGQHHMSLRQSSYDIWLQEMSNTDDNVWDVCISYYKKGPIMGLLLDIDIRQKTDGQRSLDDVMRLLYNRYYRELQRGFTEEEFWSLTEEVAGQSMQTIRRLVDTTDEIDYAHWLDAAGLYIDYDSRSIRRVEKPTRTQKKMLKALLLLP